MNFDTNPFIILTGILLLWFAVSDFRKKEIPARHFIIGAAAGFLLICIRRENPAHFYIMALLPGMGMLILAFLTKDKMGYGDGIAVMILGMLRGLRLCLYALMAGLLLLLCFFFIVILLKKANKKTMLPFIPFLFLSWCLTELLMAAGREGIR